MTKEEVVVVEIHSFEIIKNSSNEERDPSSFSFLFFLLLFSRSMKEIEP